MKYNQNMGEAQTNLKFVREGTVVTLNKLGKHTTITDSSIKVRLGPSKWPYLTRNVKKVSVTNRYGTRTLVPVRNLSGTLRTQTTYSPTFAYRSDREIVSYQ